MTHVDHPTTLATRPPGPDPSVGVRWGRARPGGPDRRTVDAGAAVAVAVAIGVLLAASDAVPPVAAIAMGAAVWIAASAIAAIERDRSPAAPLPLAEANLRGRRLDGGWFWGQDLHGAHMDGCSARRAHFNGADLHGTTLPGADLRKSVFDGADLSDAKLDGADLELADLRNANATGAVFRGSNLRLCRLDGADLSRSDLRGVDLRDALVDDATCFVGAAYDDATQVPSDVDLRARGGIRRP